MVKVTVEASGIVREISGRPFLLVFPDAGGFFFLVEGDGEALFAAVCAAAKSGHFCSNPMGADLVRQGARLMPVPDPTMVVGLSEDVRCALA